MHRQWHREGSRNGAAANEETGLRGGADQVSADLAGFLTANDHGRTWVTFTRVISAIQGWFMQAELTPIGLPVAKKYLNDSSHRKQSPLRLVGPLLTLAKLYTRASQQQMRGPLRVSVGSVSDMSNVTEVTWDRRLAASRPSDVWTWETRLANGLQRCQLATERASRCQ